MSDLITVHSTIVGPTYVVGIAGEDIVFQWNSTIGILSVKWGLTNKNDITMQFIYHDILIHPTLGYLVANSAYKGRVSFVGNLTSGHAWFKISNLTASDTNDYGVLIRERGHLYKQLSWVHLRIVGIISNCP